jgi:microcystin-dependent protein
MTLYKWSQAAASNATADSSINWQEGQAPSSVNDSGRAMMASVAKHRDDVAGAIITGGTANAYTVASYEAFDVLARLNGQIIAFTPHVTNGATVTLNVDSLGPRPLRSAPSIELLAGTLIQGTPYLALYNHADAAFYLHGFYGNPYNVPLAGMIDFIGSIAPNSSFVLPYGQAISRTTYSTLFAIVTTTYGPGDGSTTFNIPDLRGRIVAGKDDMGGSAASRLTSTYFGTNASSLGAVGGSESHTLTTAQLAPHVHSNSLADGGHVHGGGQAGGQNAFGGTNSAIQVGWFGGAGSTNSATTGITITNASAGGGSAHNNTQPTIVLNKLLRVI